MKNKIAYLIIAILFLMGCERSGPMVTTYNGHPYPRKPEFMSAIALAQDERFGLVVVDQAKSDKVWILVVTHNNHIGKMGEYSNSDPVDEGFPEVDRVIRKMKDGMPLRGEYRTEGVRNFNISSPDITLFNTPSGESLNDFFNLTLSYSINSNLPFIVTENPPIRIIQAGYLIEGIALMKDYTCGEYYTIQEWVNTKPMVAPEMLFSFKSTPPELPATFSLTVEVVTSTGRVLTSTTEPMTVTP